MNSQIDVLAKKIMDAKTAYYNSDTPIMTDAEYDRLEEELKKMDPNHPVLSYVGVKGGKDLIKHKYSMLSMGKAKCVYQKDAENNESVEYWLNKISDKRLSLVIEPKIDSLSGTVVYENGKLSYVATRGDGDNGQNVTHIADYLNVPKTVNSSNRIEVRGEIYIPKDSKCPNPENKHLRNVAVGLINRKTNRDDLKYLKFVAYQVIVDNKNFQTEVEKLEFLKTTGFQTVQYYEVKSLIQINEIFNKYLSTTRDAWEYFTDGLIISVNDLSIRQSINDKYVVSHHNHYDLALKPPSESATTRIKDIEWNVSRNGRIVPVGILEPVDINGATIQRVTLNNYENVITECKNADVVEIIRSNDVIPKLTKVISTTSRVLPIPTECPSCKMKLVVSGKDLMCTNPACMDQNIKKITFWAKQCEIDTVAINTVTAMYNSGIVRSIKDLYDLPMNKTKIDQVMNLNGFGKKKVDKMIEQINKTRSMTSLEFLVRLGIPSVSEKALKKLGIKSISDFNNFSDKTYSTGENLITYRDMNRQFIDDLLSIIKIVNSTTVTGPVKGYVCMTGTGPKSRKELEEDLKKMGYEIVSGVTKETTLLICSDLSDTSSKLKKARDLNVEITTYDKIFK